ncbi:hypothetical protein LX32DRAFT_698266 [Colletotrichum zoysiae]|uniref:Uncharacterized protein n=1 Tax=Colletotrichum zoysiae TaxID=1216348 RepID=A0AAD9H730_9PEZI|nr:hypothetical protein LX32DRAFT_698266 [Colletotrichum zoysiae]
MAFLSTIITGVKRIKTRLSKTRAKPSHKQAPTPLQKTVAVSDPRHETEKLEDAIDLRIKGVKVPFKVLGVRDKGGCKHVQIYAHTPVDDGGDPDTEKAESEEGSQIEVSLVTDKWWKDVVGEVMYVADSNCDGGGKVIYVLFCMVDPDDEVEDEEECIMVRHEFESEDFDAL